MRLLAVLVMISIVFTTAASADKYDEDAKALLQALDDKQHPVLPDLAKVSPDIQRAVFRNVADEANDCLGFYYSAGFCIKGGVTDPPPGYNVASGVEVLQALKHDEKAMFVVAMSMTKAGGLDRETIKDTINAHIQDNWLTIHNDCGNLFMLMKNDKAHSCQLIGQFH